MATKISPARNAIIVTIAILVIAVACNLIASAVSGLPFAPNWPLTALITACCAAYEYLVTSREAARS